MSALCDQVSHALWRRDLSRSKDLLIRPEAILSYTGHMDYLDVDCVLVKDRRRDSAKPMQHAICTLFTAPDIGPHTIASVAVSSSPASHVHLESSFLCHACFSYLLRRCRDSPAQSNIA